MWYDLLTLVILMFAMFRGAMKGIVWQLATIAALLMCFFFSGSLSYIVAPFIRVEPPLDHWIAMFVLYLGFSFVSFGVARVLHEWIEQMKFEALDRHLGALLGLFKGGVFSLFLTFFLVTLSHHARESIINSESGYVAAVVIDRLDPVIPGDLHALLEPYIERLDAPDIERQHRDEQYARDGERRRDGGELRDPFDGEPTDRGVRDDRLERRELAVDGRRDVRPDDLNRRDIRERRGGEDPFNDAGPDRSQRRPARRDDDRMTPPPPGDDHLSQRDRFNAQDGDGGDLLSSLPATIGEDIKQLAMRAWRATRPEHRGELKRSVTTSLPELIEKTLRQWEHGRPDSIDDNRVDSADRRDWDSGRRPSGRPADRERSRLEHDIIESLADEETDRTRVTDDIERSLRGIPDEVALAVLRDWRADLRATGGGGDPADPDPQTTSRMSLNDRILRQLDRAGISLRSLDTATQDRLRRTELR